MRVILAMIIKEADDSMRWALFQVLRQFNANGSSADDEQIRHMLIAIAYEPTVDAAQCIPCYGCSHPAADKK